MRRFTFIIILIFYNPMHAEKALTLFGYPLASRIGIAACPLTATSDGIRMLAESGFDVLTYKTIRSVAAPIKSSHIYYVDVENQLTCDDVGGCFTAIDHAPTEQNRAITNCYGIGSQDAEDAIADIKKARTSISEGKVLIVSIYGSGMSIKEQIDDFVRTAQIAAAGGAQIIEANLSCPNLGSAEPVYKNATLVFALCDAIKKAIMEIPLIIKVGIFDSYEQMDAVIAAAYQGGARGICGINTIPVRVVNSDGEPVYGADRMVSGLSGTPIHALALEFTRNARTIIDAHGFDMVLCATGGVMNPHDFDALLAAGADIALCATGAILNPALAFEYKVAH